jgi:Tfp pilus assembly protein PilF
LLLDLWPLGRLARFRTSPDAPGRPSTPAGLVLEKLPLLALAAGAAWVTALAQTAGGARRSFEALPLAARLTNAPIACATSVARSFWPRGLSFCYPHPALLDPDTSRVGLALGATLALVLVSVACLATARRRPGLAVGWLWFLGMLVPTFGLVLVGVQALADRYSYLPSIGLVIAVVFGLRELALRRPALRAPLAFLAGAALVAAGVWCSRQVATWRSSETLFAHALALEPRNWVAHTNLGLTFAERGALDRAAAEYRAALAARPEYGRASYNLGWVELQHGNLDAARALFLDSLRHGSPTAADAWLNLGVIAARRGDFEEAARAFERALVFDPDRAAAESNLGTALARLGRPAEAILHHRRALTLDPGLRFSWQGLAWLLATSRDDALRDAADALRWARTYADAAGPGDPLALTTLAAATAEAGDLAGAARLQERALVAAPAAERAVYEARLATLRAGKPLRD